jgi:MFS family permease
MRLNPTSTLTTSTCQMIYGKLYKFFPVKWVFLGSVALLELGSLVCALAPNSAALIIGRAIAGCGSAGTVSGTLMYGAILLSPWA